MDVGHETMGAVRRPAVEVGIGHQEGVDVPERDQETAACFVGAVVTEKQVGLRFVGAPEHEHV